MLWHKAWLDTRWRFLVGLGLLSCSAAAIVLMYPRLTALLPTVPDVNANSEIGRKIQEAFELSRTFGGYLWSQWFTQTPAQLGTLFAVLIGSGSLVTQGRTGALFTLSLPVSRQQVVGVRAATGLLEVMALAFVPSLAIAAFSPAVGASFSIVDALMHGVCAFFGTAVFFSLALLLSTVFDDLWRPLVIAIVAAVLVAFFEGLSQVPYGVFSVMSGETVFRNGSLPWIGLAVSGAASALLLYGATISFNSRDF